MSYKSPLPRLGSVLAREQLGDIAGTGRGGSNGFIQCEMRGQIDVSVFLVHLLPEAQGCSWGWMGTGVGPSPMHTGNPRENSGGGGWSAWD